jgi:hypothetical protein
MAILPGTDVRVEVNGVVLSDHVQSVSIETTRDDVDITAMGAVNKVAAPGLGDATITVTFYADEAAGTVNATLWPLASSTTPFNVKVRKTSAAISSTNPEYVLSALLYGFTPIDGSVGDAFTMDVEFKNASQTGLVRNTS